MKEMRAQHRRRAVATILCFLSLLGIEVIPNLHLPSHDASTHEHTPAGTIVTASPLLAPLPVVQLVTNVVSLPAGRVDVAKNSPRPKPFVPCAASFQYRLKTRAGPRRGSPAPSPRRRTSRTPRALDEIVTRPPCGVNFIAFPTRFETTWMTRSRPPAPPGSERARQNAASSATSPSTPT